MHEGGAAWLKTYVVNPLFVRFTIGTKGFHVDEGCVSCGICRKSIKTRGAYHECTGKTIPSLSAVDSPAGIEPCLRQSTMLTAVSCIASASNSAIQREFPVAVK